MKLGEPRRMLRGFRAAAAAVDIAVRSCGEPDPLLMKSEPEPLSVSSAGSATRTGASGGDSCPVEPEPEAAGPELTPVAETESVVLSELQVSAESRATGILARAPRSIVH